MNQTLFFILLLINSGPSECKAVFPEVGINLGNCERLKDHVRETGESYYSGTVNRLVGELSLEDSNRAVQENVLSKQKLGSLKESYPPAALIAYLGIMMFTGGGLTIFMLCSLRRNIWEQEGLEQRPRGDIHHFCEKYGLSKGEKEFLKVFMEGKSTKEIAEDLFISHGTAEKYINHVMVKTKTCSPLDAFVLLDRFIKKGPSVEGPGLR
ncbi:MAG: helix-turn-helix transcriptional regulator [Spirochaetales bacterium]|nr:helix-turn-helix transcriptional regulator [Spirochaetales bacterium]